MNQNSGTKFSVNTFTGHKDTDRLVLLNLNGKDLLSFCSSTPYLNKLCDEELFQNKIRNTALEKVKSKLSKFLRYYDVLYLSLIHI